MPVVETQGLKKDFGGRVAVDGLNFAVEAGEMFGLLGPNGAGKTTTIRILTTLLRPSSGRAVVCGYDVVEDAAAVREQIGYVMQEITLDPRLTGRENLSLHAALHHLPRASIAPRID